MRVEFYWIAVAAVTIFSAARLTRLATVDKFPPVKAVRTWYENKTDGSDWQWLTMCGYCFGFWAALFVVGWGYLAGVYDPYHGAGLSQRIWWLSNTVLAVAYAAAIVMAHDGADGEDD